MTHPNSLRSKAIWSLLPPAIVTVALALTLAVPSAAQGRDIPAPTPPADGERAIVIDVTDGDTIRVDRGDGGNERLRYIGIDTPETVKPDAPVEAWGPEAAAANEELVGGRVVLLERDVSEYDKYDRLLRYVWVEGSDGWLLVNAELVAQGLAEVRALLEFYGSAGEGPAFGRGCLLCNTAVEFGPNDPSGAQFVQRYFERLSRAFLGALHNAQSRGELRRSVDPSEEANFFTASVLGLFVMLRAKASTTVIESAAQAALKHLDALRE